MQFWQRNFGNSILSHAKAFGALILVRIWVVFDVFCEGLSETAWGMRSRFFFSKRRFYLVIERLFANSQSALRLWPGWETLLFFYFKNIAPKFCIIAHAITISNHSSCHHYIKFNVSIFIMDMKLQSDLTTYNKTHMHMMPDEIYNHSKHKQQK